MTSTIFWIVFASFLAIYFTVMTLAAYPKFQQDITYFKFWWCLAMVIINLCTIAFRLNDIFHYIGK
jgi:hypothetical protein